MSGPWTGKRALAWLCLGLAWGTAMAGCSRQPSSDVGDPVMTETKHSHYHVHSPDIGHGHVHAEFVTGGHTHEHTGH